MASRKWVASGFDDVFIKAESNKSTLNVSKRKSNLITKTPFSRPTISHKKTIEGKELEDVSWVDFFAPTNKDELAVNKKKVEQVETWLLQNINKPQTDKKTPGSILLLSGPSGIGKTATIVALAKQHKIEIQEFHNPNRLIQHDDWRPGDPVAETQIASFGNFLLRASRYNSLFSKNLKQIILVEEFPNIVFQDNALFHSILRKLSKVSYMPSIFIISEDRKGNSSEKSLFPKAIQEELNITEISFNPITTNAIIKALTRIILEVSKLKQGGLIEKEGLELLAESSCGDVRNAINKLQFSRTKSRKKYKSGPTKLLQCKKQSDFVNKDLALVLFHALGKILYCKRDKTGNTKEPALPKKLLKMQRLPLIENPEEVIQRTATSSENFNIFLHENYLDFMVDIDRTASCCAALSYADYLGSEWTGREVLDTYSMSIPTREIMFNSSLASDLKVNRNFHSMRKPTWFEVNRVRKLKDNDLNYNFKELKLNVGQELKTYVLPYIGMIDENILSPQQKQLAEFLMFFNKHRLESFKKKKICTASKTVNYFRNNNLNENVVLRANQDEIDMEEIHIEEIYD